MADITIAVGSPINYRIDGVLPNCSYKVFLTRSSDQKIMDIKQITTDKNGSATATFVHSAVGLYSIQAQGINCGRCMLPCKSVEVILDCSTNNVGPCNPCGTGCSSTCSMNWNIVPTSFQAGVETNTTYTANGVPNCRLKILFFDGDTPVMADGAQAFTYVQNGVPLAVPLNWINYAVGRPYNWRPAPSNEQDACLQNCTISPARINLTIAGVASGPCTVAWSISPQDPIVGQAVAGHFYVNGLPAGCTLKVQAFAEDSVTPMLSGGAPIYINIPTTGFPFSTIGGIVGDSGWWKPAPMNLQEPCVQGCDITPAAVHVTVRSAEETSGCGTLVTTFTACVGTDADLIFSGLTLGREYRFEYANAAQFAAGTWFDAGGSSVVFADATTKTLGLPAGAGNMYRWARLVDVANPTCVSNVAGPHPCADAEVSPQWWCLNGNCVESASQPAGSAGPYVSNGACTAAPCTAPSLPVSIRYSDGFSPAPAPCSTYAYGTSSIGIYRSYEFIITGVLPSAVTVTGIPTGLTRINGSSSITISGTPTVVGAYDIVLTSGSCTQHLTGTYSAACAFNFSVSPSTFVAGVSTPVTYSVSGPVGCAIRMAVYKNGSPLVISGTPVEFIFPVGSTADNNNWDASYIGATLEWRPTVTQPSCSGATGCVYGPSSFPLTVTA